MNKLGKYGEQLFATLCLKNEWAPQSSNIDENGWDTLLEFSSFKSFYRKQMVPRVFIQIKATESGRYSWGVTLKNLQSLINDQYISYLMLLVFDKSRNLEEICIVEFSEELVREVFRKVADLTELSEYKKLEKEKITINFKKGKRLRSKDFSSALYHFFNDFYLKNQEEKMLKYNIKKQKLFEEYIEPVKDDFELDSNPIHIGNTVNGKKQILCSVYGKNNIRKLHQHFLGLKQSLDDVDIKFSQSFINENNVDLFALKKLKIHGANILGNASYKKNTWKAFRKLGRCKMFNAGGFTKLLPDSFSIIRWEFIAFDIFYMFKEKKIKIKFKMELYTREIHLKAFLKEYNFLEEFFSSKNSQYSLSLPLVQDGVNYEIDLVSQNFKSDMPKLDPRVLKCLKLSKQLINELNITDQVVPGEFLKNEFVLILYDKLINKVHERMCIDIPFNEDWTVSDFDEKELRVVIPSAIYLTDSKFLEFFIYIEENIQITKVGELNLIRVELGQISDQNYTVVNKRLSQENFKLRIDHWLSQKPFDGIDIVPQSQFGDEF